MFHCNNYYYLDIQRVIDNLTIIHNNFDRYLTNFMRSLTYVITTIEKLCFMIRLDPKVLYKFIIFTIGTYCSGTGE